MEKTDSQDRRHSPRIKFPTNKKGFFVTITLERFFFKDREIICKLRDLSEGGASLYVNGELKKYISARSIGKGVRLITENRDLSFRLMRRGKVIRIIKEDNDISIVVAFKTNP
jgi:hypothetical protein